MSSPEVTREERHAPRLDQKIAVVTGASSGLGLAIAARFAAEGAKVVMASRHRESLDAAAEKVAANGGEVITCLTDVADEKEVARLFRTVERQFERLDLLVNNAGAFDGGPLEELSLDAWEHVMAVNLRGPFLCTRAAFKLMKPQKRGRIINIGSISSQRVRPKSAAYSASKHGIWGLTQVTALEGREHGITCCCLNPGNFLTPRRSASGLVEDDEPMMSCDEVAEVAFCMAALPDHVELLEATVLPHLQKFVGRG